VKLRIATRGSRLATTQSEWVAARLRELHPGLETELVLRKTRGDNVRDRSLLALSEASGVKGLFVREIQEAVLAGEADLAVHSMKDLPAQRPEALLLGAVPVREEARDVLVLPRSAGAPGEEAISDLPLRQGARVGTGSLRRRAQLLARRPDLRFTDLRGNLDTRLRKLAAGDYDAIILAAAGMRRLGWTERISATLSPDLCTPAPGQGALAVECRRDAAATIALLDRLDDPVARAAVGIERAVMERLGGDCTVPLGVYAEPLEDSPAQFSALARVVSPDGLEVAEAKLLGPADTLATALVEALEAAGARDILARLQAS